MAKTIASPQSGLAVETAASMPRFLGQHQEGSVRRRAAAAEAKALVTAASMRPKAMPLYARKGLEIRLPF
jgi:hypothetical protein